MQKIITFLFLFIFSISQAQNKSSQINSIDFKHVKAHVTIHPEQKTVSGKVSYEFDVLQGTDSLFINGRNMDFSEVSLNGNQVDFSREETGIYILHDFRIAKAEKLELNYSVKPQTGMYFINWEYPEVEASKKQVWTQGQGKFTSTWFPTFDDLREKAEFDLSFDFPVGFEVVSNGKLQNTTKLGDSLVRWQFDMDKPMSSYLLALAAGKFQKKELKSSTGDEIQLFFKPEDSAKVEPTYRHTVQIFDFFEKETGVPYPWQNYKQIPVQDFLYAGMENTATTIFSNNLMTDSIGFKDRNYVNVNAHELAHQWFGNLVTAENGKHHWLHEGFATYYALLAEREIFGEDYYYFRLYETAEQLKALSDRGKGESLLKPDASSLTFYQKGAWALHILKERIGDEAFRKGVKNYLQQYSFQNVSTENLISEMEMASGMDLSLFVKDWLEQSAFKAEEALESLKKSEFMNQYLQLAALRETPLDQKAEYLGSALSFPVNDYMGQEAVNQLSGNKSVQALELYKKAFETGNIFVRQAIAISMREIPKNLKAEYESLLNDESYLTQEAALFSLWSQFPEDRSKYLEQTKGRVGFFEKNIRMLWLTLSLVTPEFEPDATSQYYDELAGYTLEWNPFQIRENAFGYLYQIAALDENSLESLVMGTQHHTYSFRNYCRQLLKKLLTEESFRQELNDLLQTMSEEDTRYLRSQISG
ncbi:M1 family metallopeptidase [Gramella sp. GC03-9]|uniref:Aminopeptidase N n=1 Tax=Christiangramia oceanisediminis TaxID=2920386 RepID=A0A9X2RA30_9FLAO|nr:M1 family metallopeptidase [Gramella oceanisediminis]MCP9201128.1 M1 family metallopeptidase [Gramella oceanisediminis]